ncbi:hypothetical protein GCM10011416_03520 [Polaribacter pacificus]|uniref:Lipoprotein n=1 Tax=Polaribacter pacificus TaxID=1775173 RepID=A0A917HV19_9FLAO|nr:hypothetical protein [Polaribacter pacificus]GGG90234.1 hypothetical protein GCM10011416_03520 [Polaribacter pacificus]
MKTKINLKKGILLFTIVSMLIGCGITAIPLVVNKDVSLGVITVNGLQNEYIYFQVVDLDLTDFLDEDELNDVESAVFKAVEVTLSADYKNIVTQSEDLEGYLGFYVITEGVPFDIDNFRKHTEVAVSQSGNVFVKQTPNKLPFLDGSFNIKDAIKDKKVKVGIALGGGNNYFSTEKLNDNSFSFSVKVETEVEVEL